MIKTIEYKGHYFKVSLQNGALFPADTIDPVIEAVDKVMTLKTKVLIIYGDQQTGELALDWQAGVIIRETNVKSRLFGRPIMIIGEGEAWQFTREIISHMILRIIEYHDDPALPYDVFYQHPEMHVPLYETIFPTKKGSVRHEIRVGENLAWSGTSTEAMRAFIRYSGLSLDCFSQGRETVSPRHAMYGPNTSCYSGCDHKIKEGD